MQALGIALRPRSSMLRQRMGDVRVVEMVDFTSLMIESLLSGLRPDYSALPCGWRPLGVGTFANQGCRGPFRC